MLHENHVTCWCVSYCWATLKDNGEVLTTECVGRSGVRMAYIGFDIVVKFRVRSYTELTLR